MNSKSEQTIVVNIELTKGLLVFLGFLLLSAVSFLYLSQRHEKAVASSALQNAVTSIGLRQYYLTRESYDGANADTACAVGYHMASLWEILDPSALSYNTTLGYTTDDSGQGPPTTRNGFIRTGYDQSLSGAGQGNCNGWTSNTDAGFGTVAWLNSEWGDTAPSMHVWNTAIGVCNYARLVWCVED
jgi:hypothetical protein